MSTSQTNFGQSDSSQVDQPLKGLHVLLAEDCVDQGRLYLRFIQKAGAEVTLECNGQSAVDAVRDSLEVYDAIVMDFQMPELDGLDATRQLRDLGYRGAILAMTAFGSLDLKRSWFEAGCDDFLEKPLKKHELTQAILQQVSLAKETA